ncbi:LysR family transcriptional regulator [Amorphus coralli]|uniref:LysR family transcriptional regulator n=1 Tax=Amorphus coralli TaxID=340680 RepID=UPI00036D838D|nr:LysR family transcriptional regulator [Amorphus coralli]
MRLDWLEDILAVLETGSLAAAAERRFVTQPAFSRRIMAIEAHLGVELLDRSRKPAQMKPVVREERERIQEIALRLRDLQTHLRRQDRDIQNRIVISCQHAITTSVAPALVQRLCGDRNLGIRLRSANLEECYTQLMAKQADIVLLYQSETEPLPPADAYLGRIELGEERLIPVFPSPLIDDLNAGFAAGEVPVVVYPPEVFLGKVMNQEILPGFPDAAALRPRAETALTLAMKQLVTAGVGMAWLPASLVADDLASGALSDLSPIFGSARMQIVALRLRIDRAPVVDRVWEEIARLAAPAASPA